MNIELIDGAKYEGSIEISADGIGSKDAPVVTFTCECKRVGEDYRVSLDYKICAVFECARCLGDATYEDEGSIDIIATYRVLEGDEEDDGAYYERIHKKHISLIPPVEKDIVLNLPCRHLCSEDCGGICPNCGSNTDCECNQKQVDSRLDVLKELLKKF